jgi:aldehyde dehydrogenase (NAD+)
MEISIYCIDKTYIDGDFRDTHGAEELELPDPTRETPMGVIRLADAEDACRAVASAKRAFDGFSRTSREQRCELLKALSQEVRARARMS